MNEAMLKDMGGRKSRKKRTVRNPTIDRLVAHEKHFIDAPISPEIMASGGRFRIYSPERKPEFLVSRAEELDRVKGIEFGASDLKQYLLLRSQEENQIGYYSGLLLEELFRREPELEFHMDFNRGSIHHAFTYLRNANKIIIENLDGGLTLRYAAVAGGHINGITIKDSTGDIGYKACTGKGRIETLAIVNHEGGDLDSACMHQGEIGTLVRVNVQDFPGFGGSGRAATLLQMDCSKQRICGATTINCRCGPLANELEYTHSKSEGGTAYFTDKESALQHEQKYGWSIQKTLDLLESMKTMSAEEVMKQAQTLGRWYK